LSGGKSASSTTLYTEPAGSEPYSSLNSAYFKSNYLFTLRPKFGYAWDNVMVYGTAGLAATSSKSFASFKVTDLGNLGTDTYVGSKSARKLGYSVGAGVEYALTNRVSIKADYLYYDLGSMRFKTGAQADALADAPNDVALQTVKSKLSGNLVRVGLNFKL